MNKTHYFLFGTLPTITDYRFLFDITRLSGAITKINSNTSLDELYIYSAFDAFWKAMFDATTTAIAHDCEVTCLEEVKYEEISARMRDPTLFCSDLSSLQFTPGDSIFIYITNHGAKGLIGITDRTHLKFSDLGQALDAVLKQGAKVLLFVSACFSRDSSSLLSNLISDQHSLSVFVDDHSASKSANIALKRNPTLLIGTEFCHLFLSYLSNLKANDNPTIQDLATFMDTHSKSKFGAFLGSNKNDHLSTYMGTNLAKYYSPLVRSSQTQYYTVFPYNGAFSEKGVSAAFQKLLDVAFGRKITQKDYDDLDEIKIMKEKDNELQPLYSLLGKHRFVIPGLWNGGSGVLLLAAHGFTAETVHELIIKHFSEKKILFGTTWWFSFLGTYQT